MNYFILIGGLRIGLMQECLTIYNRQSTCIPPSNIPYEWGLCLLAIFIGSVGLTTTIVLLIVSMWERSCVIHARYIGFISSECQHLILFLDVKK